MDSSEKAVIVQDIKKSFRIPLEGSSGIKQKLINHLKGRSGYRDFTPLNGVSFQVNKGDFFGIVGRNGSGKSTLLKTIAGIYTPNNGSVRVNGTLVPFIELGVGFNPELTGRENVYLNGALLGFSRSEVTAMYEDIVDFAELHDFMDERLKNYSSGMQVRLAFSIAIKAQGDILLLDEVLAVGDAAFQQKCFDYFEQLKKDKKTIIIVTHDMSAVQRFCNRAMIIENGLIKKIGKPSEIADIYTEDNIEDTETKQADKERARFKLNLQIKQFESSVDLLFQCKVPSGSPEVYVGFSLFKNGMNIAEINSMEKTMTQDKVTYSLDTSKLNPGTYEISAAMFEKETRAPLAVLGARKKITLKGYDPTRGSGFKLEDNWQSV